MRNNALVADNVTYNNGDHGIDDFNVTGGRIIGNTVYYNCTDGINVEGTSGNYDIENNVSVNNATGAVINPTPIPTNPSTGQPYYTNPCNRRIGNIGVYDSAPASTTANYNLVYQSGAGAWYTWAGSRQRTSACRRCNRRPGRSERHLRQSAFRQRRGVELPAERRDPRPSIRRIPSPRASRRPTSWAGPAWMTRLLPIPATHRGRTTTAARTSISPAVGGGQQTPPTAALTVTPASGNAPLSVTADASASTAGSSPISSYSFDFGDGTIVGPQSSATANHTYQSAGNLQGHGDRDR